MSKTQIPCRLCGTPTKKTDRICVFCRGDRGRTGYIRTLVWGCNG